MKNMFFSLVAAGFFAIVGLALVPPARADCCNGCDTIISSTCCNIFHCNCDGPCSNFGCGGTPRWLGEYCGVTKGYVTFLYNNGCAYTDDAAAPGTAPKTPTREEGSPLTLSPAKPQERFDAIDTNHDRSISFEEAQAWIKKQPGGSAMSEADLQAKLKQVDKNGDGKITPDEFDFTLAKK